ncbi:EamA family transporter [Streptomyces sp. NPDC021749]|uniref:EamA family transporter n=1 Tax=Streptomyces sp. NPDC021749 TaxID=3154905 RepID=UPI0033CCA5BC
MPVAVLVARLFAGPSGPASVTWPLVLTGLALAVLHPVIRFSLEILALRRLSTTAVGTLMSLEPALALVIGAVALGQLPGAGPAAGVVRVVLAGIGATRTNSRAPAPGEGPRPGA